MGTRGRPARGERIPGLSNDSDRTVGAARRRNEQLEPAAKGHFATSLVGDTERTRSRPCNASPQRSSMDLIFGAAVGRKSVWPGIGPPLEVHR